MFQTSRFCLSIGIGLVLLALVLWFVLRLPLASLEGRNFLSATAALIVLVWIAIFVLCYGMRSFRAAVFPLIFLLLIIPLPIVVSERAIAILQKGSADASYLLFRVLGVPVIRHGFLFSLPGVDIEVAQQCSGIRSGLSLFITGLLMEHVLLRGAWKKAFFVLCIVPIAICKNAVRIVTIAWLGIYVNPGFFTGRLHRQGGLPFSLLALAMMALLVWLLGRPFRSRTLEAVGDPRESRSQLEETGFPARAID